MSFRVVVRSGARVQRHEAPTLAAALARLEAEAQAVELGPRRETVDLRGRTFTPREQVAARIALRGPGRLRAGVDVRGDGFVEAWTGGWRRSAVPLAPGESAYDALQRVLG